MCIGPLKRLWHWGPILALGIVKIVSFSMWHCSSMWWPPFNSIGGFLNIAIFTMWNALTLYHFFSAMIIGPGILPINWKPENENDLKYLQFCQFCDGYKAPRAHHCRKCNKCVKKMDHHCPWINNCCGHDNHTHFVLFLFCAVCGCVQASVVLICSLYRALHRKWYIYYGTGDEPIVVLSLIGFILCTFALGMALGVVIAVGGLFYFQIRGIIRNETAIENWIVTKAKYDRTEGDLFTFPYNLGWKKNFFQIFNWNFKPKGDGITWIIAPNCDQYSLTKEQIKQKEKKRNRSKIYKIIENYNGSWFPVTKGLRICCSFPLSDESRIKLNENDRVSVTRWKRHWLYGEKIINEFEYSTNEIIRIRGWFPRICAVEITKMDENRIEEKKIN